MATTGRTLFDTTIGPCGVAWGPDGLLGVLLPDSSGARTHARLARRYPDSADSDPPASVQQAIAGMTALLEGEPRDLLDVTLDTRDVGEFEARVYDIARHIPPGSVMTYGEIARQLGEPAAARAVGQALGSNPWPIVVPCHRVLGADGKVGGFSAPGGVASKLRMLTIERARTSAAPSLFEDLPLAVRPGPR